MLQPAALQVAIECLTHTSGQLLAGLEAATAQTPMTTTMMT